MSGIKELRELSIDQVEVFIEDLTKEIFSLKNQLSMNKKLEKPHLIKEKRRDKARALMVLSEKKRKNK
jgi:large subunit ribosomal protein L29